MIHIFKPILSKYCTFTILLVIFSINAEAQQAISSNEEKELRKQVEINPDSLTAHENYLKLFTLKDSAVIEKQYEVWISMFPKSANVPFAVGRFFYINGSSKATPFLLKATSISKSFTKAWEMLAAVALHNGNDTLQVKYLERAIKADVKNPAYRIKHAIASRQINRDKLDSLCLDIELRFPGTDAGAQALLLLATEATDLEVKFSYFELLKHQYSKLQPQAFRSGMSGYFTDLINNHRFKDAFDLALSLVVVIDKNKLEWKHKLQVAKEFLEVKKHIDLQEYAIAIKNLEKIPLKNSIAVSTVGSEESRLLMIANLNDLSNNTRSSFDSVLKYYSKFPSKSLKDQLFKYASKLQKDSALVVRQIDTLRKAKAKKATLFSLLDYNTNKKVSLDDYKGKVILLTYWFPSCAPCREEFPYFEESVKAFSQDEIAYIGININRKQDDYVLPFLNATGYSFVPLKDDVNWDKENLAAQGAPTNYLIDKEGQIIFSEFRINRSNEESLKLMIQELINSP